MNVGRMGVRSIFLEQSRILYESIGPPKFELIRIISGHTIGINPITRPKMKAGPVRVSLPNILTNRFRGCI